MQFNADPTIAALPAVVEALNEQRDDYTARVAALKLVRTMTFGPAHWGKFDLDEVMVHPGIREIISCLASMAGSAFVEWAERDPEWAEDLIVRELRAAEQLAELTCDA